MAVIGVVLLAPYAVQAQAAWIQAIQRRVAVTVDLVNGAKGVKMSGLVDRLLTILTGLRLDEVSASKRYRSIVTGIFTFGIYYSKIPNLYPSLGKLITDVSSQYAFNCHTNNIICYLHVCLEV